MWQDITFGAGSLIFSVALIPTAYDIWVGKVAINKYTAFLTVCVLLSFTIAYASLGLWYATETTMITAALWIYIGIGSWYNGKTTHN